MTSFESKTNSIPLSLSTDATFGAILHTRGRKTGKPHIVKLKAVSHSGNIYFSRHTPDSDWYLNVSVNANVLVQFGDKYIAGTARIIKDSELLQCISELKYPGEKRAKEKRVAVEVMFEKCGNHHI